MKNIAVRFSIYTHKDRGGRYDRMDETAVYQSTSVDRRVRNRSVCPYAGSAPFVTFAKALFSQVIPLKATRFQAVWLKHSQCQFVAVR